MFSYKIYGALSDAAGLQFNSCVPNLQDKPELWADECPYIIPKAGTVEVRLVEPALQGSTSKGHAEVAEEVSC